MKHELHYGSFIQLLTNQDIEKKTFKNKNELITYLKSRFHRDFDGVFTVEISSTDKDSVEFPSAIITRSVDEIFPYIEKNPYTNKSSNFFVFEWESYQSAFNYLQNSFETSSKMYCVLK